MDYTEDKNYEDERLRALINNRNAVMAAVSSVEGTIGPKGMDVMLVDSKGDSIITNDGVTILTQMEVTHPAAKLLVSCAYAQEISCGDGTTTAAIIGGYLVDEGVNCILKGVPPMKIIQGIDMAKDLALRYIEENSSSIGEMSDERLYSAVRLSVRGGSRMADLVMNAANSVGYNTLMSKSFKLSECVMGQEFSDDEVFKGIIIDRYPCGNSPPCIDGCRLLITDEIKMDEDMKKALCSESGLSEYREKAKKLFSSAEIIRQLGINIVLLSKGIDDEICEILTNSGIMVVDRVLYRDLARIGRYTKAKPVKGSRITEYGEELNGFVGSCGRVLADDENKQLRIENGNGNLDITIVVGGSSCEVLSEKVRIAKDGASALQSAIRGGIVAGGGSIEIGISNYIENRMRDVQGLERYGMMCFSSALKRPMFYIIKNSGFNSLEITEKITQRMNGNYGSFYCVDCDNGEIINAYEAGIYDTANAKLSAVNGASEFASAILRISSIIKKMEQ